jgi:hypothetical protein
MQSLSSILLSAGSAIVLTTTTAALAQAPRSSVDSAATSGVPEFRDPKTGQIWTPLNVGQKSGPNTPADRAFNPSAQTATVPGVVVQNVPVSPLGSVPITAGPTVPIVNLESASLRAVPGARWQVTMYLDNNSGNAVSPVITCSFTNSGKPVETTRAMLAQVGPGARVGFVVLGPKVELFVDHAGCNVDSP